MGVRKETPTLAKVIEAAIDNKLIDVHTGIPAIIVSYDYDSNLAVVKPMIKRVYIQDKEEVSLPNISNVPVAQYRIGNTWLRLPVKAGNKGFIIFMERSIDRYMETGEERPPDDIRRFDLSDAVFQFGLVPKTNSMKSDSSEDAIELRNDKMVVEMLPNGKIKIRNETGELLSELSKAFAALSGEPFLALKSVYAQAKTIIDSMKG